MKKIIIFFVVFIFLQCAKSDRQVVLVSKFDSFQAQLKSKLQTAIKEQGVVGAIAICKDASPDLEKIMSDGMVVRRVSEKNRNPLHAPDMFEAETFAFWKKEIEQGRKPALLAKDTPEGLRVMKPIFLQDGVCLKCHGEISAIEPMVLKKIKEAYPDDKATGYTAGDLRGAFSGILK